MCFSSQCTLKCSHRSSKGIIVGFFFSSDESGLLVHCISGWDRTPLFVSLLRLSLWAVSLYFFSSFGLFYLLFPPWCLSARHSVTRLLISAPLPFISDFGNPKLNLSASAPVPLLIYSSPHKSNLPFQTLSLISRLCIHCCIKIES